MLSISIAYASDSHITIDIDDIPANLAQCSSLFRNRAHTFGCWPSMFILTATWMNKTLAVRMRTPLTGQCCDHAARFHWFSWEGNGVVTLHGEVIHTGSHWEEAAE
ncbi:hypothetical protein M758_9G013100 [Ceratodon purpureus]|uniref:Uncharacterized protein n=1 Tax=Ceratodon purpureus TaxID=3225 RepID=A0A8T0GP55_CERPU|nr:hypothetical protein KC19_9G013500 [Ceratodon purpureus]KAG0604849.1 hypothetical protein M758_9G013100 [Ceratodon purpureus]